MIDLGKKPKVKKSITIDPAVLKWAEDQVEFGKSVSSIFQNAIVYYINAHDENGASKDLIDDAINLPVKKLKRPTVRSPRKKPVKFIPPELSDCINHAVEKGYGEVEGEKFYLYWFERDWLRKNKSMKCWKSSMRSWMLNKQSNLNTPIAPTEKQGRYHEVIFGEPRRLDETQLQYQSRICEESIQKLEMIASADPSENSTEDRF